MRVIDYNQWKENRKRRFAASIEMENTLIGRAPGRRPRDPEKEEILAEIDKARRKRYIESGKMKMIGPRHWIWRVDFRERSECD